jgi:hypothetical protein
MSDWLELELAHRLAPAEAPGELWERVESGLAGQPARASRRSVPRDRPPARISLWRAWPVAATAMVALAAGALWLADARDPRLDIRQLAAGVSKQAVALDLRTSDPLAVRRWLRQHTGLDVPLPASTAVKLEGARMVRQGAQRVAAVEYRVGQDKVTLLVARADPRRPLPPHGGRTAVWQARDQVYALAGANPDRVEAACQLCHASL